MAGCGGIAEELREISEKFDEIQQRSDWDQISEKIYESNKDVIDRDVRWELEGWEEGAFFNSGNFAGQIEKIFLDNVPVQELTA